MYNSPFPQALLSIMYFRLGILLEITELSYFERTAMQLEELVKSKYEKIVAVEPLESGGALLFYRDAERVREEKIAFKPFMLLHKPELLNGSGLDFEVSQLAGAGLFRTLVRFPSEAALDSAEKFLKQSTGFSASAPNAPFRFFSDMSTQVLISESFRLFRKMSIKDLLRFQFDIETLNSDGFEFSNAERENDSIIIISMSDSSGWEKVISIDNMSEKELIEEFVKTIKERDPDVIEGYNIFRFDLPYIETRARRHKVKLNIGRDGSLIRKRNSRFNAAERTINYTRYDIFGRHIIDVYHLVQFYDVSNRDLESYGLKSVAIHFGVAAPDRTYIEGSLISEYWRGKRAELLKYALDDVRETLAISNILSPSYFYQAQLVPMKYQDCIVRGNATRIDAMLAAEYISRGHSLPVPGMARQFAGALTQAFDAGVFKNVWHCDVRSLYPSIILADKLCPAKDELGIFPFFLEKLRNFRLAAKDAARTAGSEEEKEHFSALQSAFKILINSFYGYLGFAQGTFNDFDIAEKVTSRGREILTMMLNYLEKSDAHVIEMDTDGIYFQPPSSAKDERSMEGLIQKVLPAGIEVELDSTYKAMFCYKSKNYALLSDDSELIIAGAALKSRGLEPFQRDYMKEIIRLLLEEKSEQISAVTEKYKSSIKERKFPLEYLSKTETLNDSLEVYKKKISSGEGRRSAAYELAVGSGREYKTGDQISFYITGMKKKVSAVDNCRLLVQASSERDENVEYYLAKIDELYKRFEEFIKSKPEGEFKLE